MCIRNGMSEKESLIRAESPKGTYPRAEHGLPCGTLGLWSSAGSAPYRGKGKHWLSVHRDVVGGRY